jgi:hypothetical protein
MRPDANRWPADVLLAIGVYLVTVLPVLIGLTLASTPGILWQYQEQQSFLVCCTNYDGAYFEDIADYGYWVYQDAQSPIAFFPGHPLAAQFLSWLTGWSSALSLVVVSNLSLVAALALVSAFLRSRYPDQSLALRATTLGAIAFYPAGLFFRVAYSESLFLLCVALLLLGLARRWPLLVLALVAGAATGVRAVGVVCAGAVLLQILLDRERGSVGRRLLTAVAVAPVACWGLLAFMAFQYAQFDNPFAFAEAQHQWGQYVRPPGDATPMWVQVAIAEPIWNTYIPGSARHWSLIDRHRVPGLGMAFWNPIAFVLAVLAVAFGWRRGWLNREEALLALGLLFIPYLSRGYAMSMASHARFVSVVIPVFVVLGRVLSRWPVAVSCALFAVMASMLTVWTAMFGAWWPVF